MYRCYACLTRKSIREQSFLDSVTHSFQEFIRVVFYYFAKGYEPELAHREMTENTDQGSGAKLTVSQVYSLYVHARDRISKHFIESVEARKFGGKG